MSDEQRRMATFGYDLTFTGTVEAEVVRTLPITSGETAVAVHFLVPPQAAVMPLRRAA